MKKAFLILLVICLLLGCGSFRKAHRIEPEAVTHKKTHPIEPETVTDLSGKWNDTDARLVAREMIADCLSRAWIPAYVGVTGGKPVVTIAPIHNRNGERIDTKTLAIHFERELLNSDQISFISSRGQRDEIRDERLDEHEFASRETIKRISAETGANFILVGAIKSTTDEIQGAKVVYYQTDLEMINVKSMAKVWKGTKTIKKEISRKKIK